MPVLFIESEPRFQTLIGISHLSQDSSVNSHRASRAGVVGLLALSAIVIALAAFCVFMLRDLRIRSPNIQTTIDSPRDEPNVSRFHSTRSRCLRRMALINAAKQAAPPSSTSRLRPLLLGRSSELWADQQDAIKEKQEKQKQQDRATLILVAASRPRFPFGTLSPERKEPQLQHSRSWPNVQRATPDPQTSVRRRSDPGKPSRKGHVQKDKLKVKPASQEVSSMVQGPRASNLDLFRANGSTDEAPSITIQRPTPPRSEASRTRKGSKDVRRPRQMRLERVQDARKRHLTRQRTRKSYTLSHHKVGDIDDPFVITERRANDSPKKPAMRRAKPGKKKNGHNSKTSSKASPRKRALSPRKPLGNITNAQTSPLKTPSKKRPSLHINGIPADDPQTPPQMARVRSPPKNRAYLSTRWKPRPPRPSLTITVFIKERASRALYPGRRLNISPSVGMTLTELKKEIEKAAGHKIGILKGMTLVGHTTMNVPLMSDRFYGQWVKERVAEGGVGVIEVMKVDR